MARRITRESKIKKFSSKMQASLLLVFCVIIFAFLVLIGRIFYLTRVDGDKYSKRVLSQQTYSNSTLPYKRGSILDRNGTVLAKSVKVYNLILDPVVILDKESYKEPTVNAIKEAFSIEVDEIYKILEEKSKSRYVILEKGLSYEQVQKFEELQEKNDFIKGVWFEDDYIREYPLNNLASSVMGFTFSGNVGNSGIEGYYNEKLNGVNGSSYGYFDSELNLVRTVKAATDGHNVVSTIDANVQAIVEKYIKEYHETYDADNTAVIIGNPNNGEIYAMASNISYDLNNPRDLSGVYSEEELEKMTEEEEQEALNQLWRNFCVSDLFEPGSTFKPITVGAALEEGVISDYDEFDCDGYENINGTTIRCARREGHGHISLSEAIAYSCNDALMQIGERLGSKLFSQYQENFLFGQKTGIDLPGEAKGIVFTEEQLKESEVSLATSSFGQSLNVTMVELFAAFNSVINGGYYYTPHIVKQITTDTGAVVDNATDYLVKRTVSESTSSLLRSYMEEAVTSGTAKSAAVEGYDIGGKTGTAQKLPRSENKYLLSFIGFTPVEDPEVVIYVIIDNAKGSRRNDSGLATEFASDIMEEVLPFLGIYPSTSTEEEENTEEKKEENKDEKETKEETTDDLTQVPETTTTPQSSEDLTETAEVFSSDDIPVAGESNTN